MDLRIIKTKNNIINAFIELRSKKPLEKITVKELSERALISKATFYLHYKDIYDLSDSLESELVNSILESISHPEYFNTNLSTFTKELFNAFASQSTLIKTVFSGNQNNHLAYKIEAGIKNLLYEKYPDLKNDIKKNIILTYHIYGGYYAYINNTECNTDTLISTISELSSDTILI